MTIFSLIYKILRYFKEKGIKKKQKWIAYKNDFDIGMKNFKRTGYFSDIVGRHIPFPTQKIAFIDVSKVASSSIKRAFVELNEIEIGDKNVHVYFNENYSSYDPIPSDYFSFAFVRNPFERLVSAYKNKYLPSRYYPYKNYLFGFMKLGRDFDYFARKVALIPDKFAEGHFVSQTAIIFDKNGKPIPKYIYRFETLNEDWQKIKEQTGVALPNLPHYNSTKKDNWKTYYTPKLAKIVYKRYKKDIKNFGYENEYHELLKFLSENNT